MMIKRQGRRSAETAENTRQHILRVATNLFCEFGYARISLRMISEKAQISHSLIRHHFGSKEQIWYSISDKLHKYIDAYCQAILNELPDMIPVNEKLYQFTVRLLALNLIDKKPVQLMADVIRQQEGERFDYFMDRSGKIQPVMNQLMEDYNQLFPTTPLKIWEIKWQMVMFAHSAASLHPFLKKTWGAECNNSEEECLLKHWQIYNEMMIDKFHIAPASQLHPKELNALILDKVLGCHCL